MIKFLNQCWQMLQPRKEGASNTPPRKSNFKKLPKDIRQLDDSYRSLIRELGKR